MTPEVPLDFPMGKPTHNHLSTNYNFGVDPFSGGLVLSFRSAGFGWLTFHIPQAEFERMYREQSELRSRLIPPGSGRPQ
jgi:hypothetical protein